MYLTIMIYNVLKKFQSKLRLLTFKRNSLSNIKYLCLNMEFIARKSCELDYWGSVKFQGYQRFYQSGFFILVKKRKTFISLSIKTLTISIGNAMYQWKMNRKRAKHQTEIFFSKTVSRRNIFSTQFSRKEKKETNDRS